MIVDKTLEQMLKEIEFKRWIKYDILIPEENPKLFEKSSLVNVITPNKRYINSIFNLVKVSVNTYYVLGEIFLNAFDWGNNNQEYLPVSVKVFEGSQGSVVRIRDSGQGFDFREVLLKRNEGKKYWRRGGCGFRNFYLRNDYQISFEGKGNIVNLLVLKQKDL